MQIVWNVTCQEHLIQMYHLLISHFVPGIQGIRALLSEDSHHTDSLGFWQSQAGQTRQQLLQLHLRVLC